MKLLSKRLASLAAALSLALLVGCYSESDPEPPTTTTGQAPPAAQPTGTLQSSGGGGSALGGAVRSTRDIIDKAEQASSDLAAEYDR